MIERDTAQVACGAPAATLTALATGARRCGKCNGEFIPEARGPQELPQGHGVPEGIRAHHEEFWVCAQCQAVYWKGGWSMVLVQVQVLIGDLRSGFGMV